MFRALAKKNINIDLISTSNVRIACVINALHVREAVQAVHKAFGLNRFKRKKR
jgi:aspartate kinase